MVGGWTRITLETKAPTTLICRLTDLQFSFMTVYEASPTKQSRPMRLSDGAILPHQLSPTKQRRVPIRVVVGIMLLNLIFTRSKTFVSRSTLLSLRGPDAQLPQCSIIGLTAPAYGSKVFIVFSAFSPQSFGGQRKGAHEARSPARADHCPRKFLVRPRRRVPFPRGEDFRRGLAHTMKGQGGAGLRQDP
jgi:hypothetical protein